MGAEKQITDIIFDLDGTLIDSAPSILDCLSKTLDAHGFAPKVPLERALIGPPLRDTLRKVSGRDDGEIISCMLATFVDHYDVIGYQQTEVFAGIDTMLRSFKGFNIRLHLATNKRLKATSLIVEYFGWRDLFSTVYAVDMRIPLFESKGEMLRELLRAERIEPYRAVYVGDRHEDREAASDNDLLFIAATWGHTDDDFPGALGAQLAVSNPADIALTISRNLIR